MSKSGDSNQITRDYFDSLLLETRYWDSNLACVEAPNWTQDGKYLVYNSQGKIWRLDLEPKEVFLIPTGIADICNNDHVLNPYGTGIACSNGRNDDNISKIYKVDFATGEVKCLVSENLSYLHGWSPDSKKFAYVSYRA